MGMREGEKSGVQGMTRCLGLVFLTKVTGEEYKIHVKNEKQFLHLPLQIL